jgi:hypothetical protein
MNVYGTPHASTAAAAPNAVHLQKARRAISAAKHATGWRKKAYEQDAVAALIEAEKSVTTVEGVAHLFDTLVEYSEVAGQEGIESAIAQTIRSYF